MKGVILNTQIIFFDIDGTLIDMKKKKITEKTLYTLKALKAKGIKICLATGRSPMQLPHFEGLEFDAYLTYNGSYCFNDQETLYKNPLLPQDVENLIANATAIHRPLSLETKDRLASNGTDSDLEEYHHFGGVSVTIFDDFYQIPQTEDVFQVILGCRSEDHEAILKNVEYAAITGWWDRAVDIIPADGGKGKGILKILDYFQIPIEASLAFGDGGNDIEMLKTVGTGVAMANAKPDLKKVADVICPDVTEDGIYQYCIEKKLIQPAPF